MSTILSTGAANLSVDTLHCTSQACVADAVTQDAAAASLEQRLSSMVARAADAVSSTVACDGTLLAASAQYTAAVRCAADCTAKMLCKHMDDDAIVEADTNAEQLASWSALTALSPPCVDWFDSAAVLGDTLLFSLTTPTPSVVLCVASVQTDAAQLHRIYSSDIDTTRSTVNGQGLTAYDPSAGAAVRQQNVIYVVPRDVDGAIVEWVTPADISLSLMLNCMDSGLSLWYDVDAVNSADGWRVAYAVDGDSTEVSTISLQLDVRRVQLWHGDVRVRVFRGTYNCALLT